MREGNRYSDHLCQLSSEMVTDMGSYTLFESTLLLMYFVSIMVHENIFITILDCFVLVIVFLNHGISSKCLRYDNAALVLLCFSCLVIVSVCVGVGIS